MELKKIKLNKLSGNALAKRQMKELKGGESCCSCACLYANDGGSSTFDNGTANQKHCYHSAIPEIVVIGKRKK